MDPSCAEGVTVRSGPNGIGPLEASPVASDAMSEAERAGLARWVAVPPWPETRRRLPRLVAGLVLCGIAFGLTIEANLGLDPWDVLHQGISNHTGVPIGLVTTLLGLVILVAWIPLRERIGVGTVLNALLIGTVMDILRGAVPDPTTLPVRWAMLVAGLFLAGPGIGLYIGARLGPGPRDGIMTGLAQRGPSIRVVRTGIELVALAAGWALGGTVGIGTVAFAVTIGPNAQFWLERLDMGHAPGFDPSIDPEVEPDATLAAG